MITTLRSCRRFSLILFFVTALIPTAVARAFLISVTPDNDIVRQAYPSQFTISSSQAQFPANTPVLRSLQKAARSWSYVAGTNTRVLLATLPNAVLEHGNPNNVVNSIILADLRDFDIPGYPNAQDLTAVTLRWIENGRIKEIDTILNTRFQDKWRLEGSTVDSTYSGTVPYAQYDVAQIITHELGHAFGLDHETDIVSTMLGVYYPGVANYVIQKDFDIVIEDMYQLHADDRNGLRFVYPQSVQTVNEVDLALLGWKAGSSPLGSVGYPLDLPEDYNPPHVEGHYKIGGTMGVELTAANLGTTELWPKVAFFLTSTLAAPSANAAPFFVTDLPTAPLAAIGALNRSGGLFATAVTQKVPVPIPCGTAEGLYYLWAKVDPFNVLGDQLPTNNRRIVGLNNSPYRIFLERSFDGTCAPQQGQMVRPGQPGGVDASDWYCGSCKLTWNVPTTGGAVQYYKVYKDGEPLPATLYNTEERCLNGACSWWETTATSTVVPAGTHTYYVIAKNQYGESLASDTAEGTVLASPYPAVLNLTATTNRCDKVQVAWDWPEVPDPPAFLVRYFPDESNIGNSFTYTLSGASRNHPHIPAVGDTVRYAVWAVNLDTYCEGPSPVLVKAYRVPALTGAPTLLSATSDRCDGVQLAWQYNGPAGGRWTYEVFRDSTTGLPLHSTTVSTELTWVDTSAESGRLASYWVRAVNLADSGCNPSAFSNSLSGRRRARSLHLTSNVPGAVATVDSAVVDLSGSGFSMTCSQLGAENAKLIACSATQSIGGVKYCFDSWSDGGFRSHTVTVTSATTITLNLVATGAGPTTYDAGAILPPELSDCRSPHVFLGEASAPSGLVIHPGSTVRFPRAGGSSPYAGLSVDKHLYATDVTFETVDGTDGNVQVGAWKGIKLTDPNFGQLALSRCTIRNATTGIGRDGGRVFSAQIDTCTFEKNNFDVVLEYANTVTPVKTLTLRGNYFKSKDAVQAIGPTFTSSTPVAAIISGNTFAGTTTNSKWLRLSGGFTGQVNSNTFNMGNSGNIGVDLSNTGQYPNVSLTGNTFQFALTQRTSLIAPDVAGHPYIAAYYNNWNLSTGSEIEESILHYHDTMNNTPSKAEVLYEPFTAPNGGPGGGGGSGGCPFVLSRQADGSYTLENSILGASEARQGPESFVRDAYPLEYARASESGEIHLRIAEFERETDFFDRVGLEAVALPEGGEIGVDPNGAIVAFRPVPGVAQVVSWSGRNAPFISPVAKGNAYTGEAGDSLELLIPAPGPISTPISRRFYISMIPKPPQAPSVPSSRIGVIVRVAGDDTKNRWVTSQPLVPRAIWSNAIVPFELPAADGALRLRVIWNTQHALGWVGIAEVVEPTVRVTLPLRSAVHSVRGEAMRALTEDDGEIARIEPGEHIDLTFDGRGVPAGSRLVLTARGRYQLGGMVEIAAPAVAYADQNRPNPFNPNTEIRFGIPQTRRVRITIFDVAGRRVRTILEREIPAGHHTASWDGTDALNRPVASGVYFYQLKAGEFSSRKRMVLVR